MERIKIEEELEEVIRYISNAQVAVNTCAEGEIPPTSNICDFLGDAYHGATYIKGLLKDKE